MNLKGCYSHESDNWKTPKKLYEAFMNKGYIDCFKYQSHEDELLNNYDGKKLFINPPYSKMKYVTKWIIEQLKRKNCIFLLIPARTDTVYFHELLKYNPTIYFIKGRLKFNDGLTPAPFSSIIMSFISPYLGYLWYQIPTYKSVSTEEFIERWIY